jgi:Na+-transporting methylmalonyl-CoA/oxaloacetate decarboxylase beta subunit
MQDLVLNVPKWATSAYALAVTAGVLGSLLMLMRKSWAVPVFILSLVGVIVQDFHAFVLKNAYSIIGPTWSAVSLVVFVVAVLLAWYSRQARGRGWLA